MAATYTIWLWTVVFPGRSRQSSERSSCRQSCPLKFGVVFLASHSLLGPAVPLARVQTSV